MLDLKAHRRVVIGRNIALTAGIMYALSRALYYVTVRPEALSGAQNVIAAGGKGLGLWAGLWFAAAVLCVADMVNRRTRYGLSLVVGIATAWGVGYIVIWACTGFTDFMLITSAIGWLTPAMLVFGFLLKVTALQDMLRQSSPPPGGTDG
jgi:hypothetical protein